MAVDKSKILTSLKRDLKQAETLKKITDAQVAGWRAEYDGKPYGNEVAGKSRIVSSDIKKQSEWSIPSLVDPFVSSPDIVKCSPITAEDTESARQNELLLNTQFCRKFDRYNFMMKSIKLLEREGTLVVQTGWEYEDEVVTVEAETVEVDEYGNEYITTSEIEETIVKKNQPTARICRMEDIYIDPTCEDDMDKCQFVIYRYETDISTLRKDGRYKNLDRVAKSLGSSSHDGDYRPEDDTRFQFADEARKKLMVFEYWGNYDVNEDGEAEAIVCAWVGNTIIRLEDNPYPDGKPPFLVVPFRAVPFQMHGEANAALIGDNQKVKTAIVRGIIDNMAQSNNGQLGIKKGALDISNRKKMLAGQNFEFNSTPGDFWQGSYNPIPSSAFDMIGLMNNEIESLTGVKSFSGGISGNSIGSTATSARGAMDAQTVRRMNIVRNIAENLVKPLLRKWMVYNAEFLEEEEVVRITNSEFVPVRKDDLSGRVDVDLTVETSEENNARAQQLSFLLQTLGNNVDPAITQELMAQILDLSRMPDQAEKIRTYKPEPDPMEQQIKQLQLENMVLENQKLKSEIQRNTSIANENDIDRQVKLARAARDEAQTRLIHSNADFRDLEFLSKEAGEDEASKIRVEIAKLQAKLEEKDADHQRSMEHKVLDHKANLDVESFKAMQHDKKLAHASRLNTSNRV
jgi:hypothetical protein